LLSIGEGVVDRFCELELLPGRAADVDGLVLEVLDRPDVLSRVPELPGFAEVPDRVPAALLRDEVLRELVRGVDVPPALVLPRPLVAPPRLLVVLLPVVLRPLVPLRVPVDVRPIDPCRYWPDGVAICPWRSPPMPARS
jgi:hypothetical protein